MSESLYPEHKKLDTIIDQSQIIGDFLHWMINEKQMEICYLDRSCDGFVPYRRSINTWLAEYFGIDMNALEAEQRAIIKRLREMHTNRKLPCQQ